MPRALWAKAPFVLAQHRAVLVAVIVASFLVAMAASSAPLLRAGAESEALKGKLELLTPLGAGLTIENYRRPESAAADRARRAAAVRFARGLPYVQTPILTTTAFAQVGGPAALAGNPLFVIPMARTRATEHVHRVAGQGSNAWIPGSVATVADLAPGDTLHLLDGGPGVRPRTVSLPVSAVYRGLEGDRDNPYWVNFTVRIRARTPDSPLPPAFVLVRRDELYRISARLRNPYLENTFEFPAAPEALTPARARKIADSFAAARRALGRPTPLAKSLGCGMTQVTRCSVTSSIQAAVILARNSVDALTPVILLLAAFAGLIAAGAAFIAGTFNVRRRSGEARLSVVLGERRASFAARAALEALLPAVVGAAGGLGTAALLVRVFTPDGTVDGSVVRRALLAAAGAATVAVAAVATGAWVARGRTIDQPSAAHRLARVPWELPLLAAAIGIYAVVHRGGGLVHDASTGSHPRLIVLLLPLFLAAALGGLGLRAVRWTLRRREPRSDVLYLVLRRVTAPRALAAALTVTAAVSFGALTFAELLGASLSSNSAEKAYVANGSDVQGLIDPTQPLPQTFPYPITKVLQTFDSVYVGGSTVEAIAIDPATFIRVIHWEWPDDPRGAVRKLLASRAPLPVITTDGARNATAIDVAGKRLPVTVVGTVHAFPGLVAGETLVVLPHDALERAGVRAGIVGDPLETANAFVWARGDTAGIESALSRSSLAPQYVTTVAHFLESADLSTAARTYSFLRVIALAAALVALVALLLYLHARSRAELVTGALLERMGMSRARQAGSVALEAAALVTFAMLAGAASGLLAARPLIAHVDPLPQFAPGSSIVVPWTLLAVSSVAVVAIATVAAALAAAVAGRAEVGEALRVA